MTAPEAENRILAVRLRDGFTVEAVYYGTGTLCISSQVGCAMGCPFCASGSRGLVRNLAVAELWNQVAQARREELEPARVTVSGIGEPLHNRGAVRTFLLEARTAGIPVSLTTTGQPLGGLAEFLGLPHRGLVVSLHGGTAAVHRRLIPRGPDFEGLWKVLEAAWPRLGRRGRRRVGINYLLAPGLNDDPAELDALAARLRPFPEVTVHLLVPNPVPESPLVRPTDAALSAAWERLRARGISVRRANRWRRRARGGCGTLAVRSWDGPGRVAGTGDRRSVAGRRPEK